MNSSSSDGWIETAGITSDAILSDIRKYESRYRKLVSTTAGGLLYERNFRRGLNLFLIAYIIIGAYIFSGTVYSYFLAVLLISMQLYIYFLTEKLGSFLKIPILNNNSLAYFRQKRDIASKAMYLRWLSIINSIFFFLFIWLSRSPDRRFNDSGIAFLIVISIMAIAGILYNAWYMQPVISFLNRLVGQMEDGHNVAES